LKNYVDSILSQLVNIDLILVLARLVLSYLYGAVWGGVGRCPPHNPQLGVPPPYPLLRLRRMKEGGGSVVPLRKG